MKHKRFEALLQYLDDTSVLYDIGTDHARLPILALKRGIIRRAIAVDNKVRPLEQAHKNIVEAELQAHIETVLASGLEALDDTCDTAVMAGLGGRVIHDTFAGADTKNLRRFIFQPANHIETVRMLAANGFAIVDEDLVDEGAMRHIIIVCERGTQLLTDKERRFGPVLLKKKPPGYRNMLLERAAHLRILLGTIPFQDAKKTFVSELSDIEEVLHEWHTN